MNKNFFGSKIGTILSFIVCVIVAFCIWLYVSYAEQKEIEEGIGNTEASFVLTDDSFYMS